MRIHKIDVGDAPSVADRIFESLRRAVISGTLKDGDPLRQEELARHFNASRIPVRESLTRLEQHGLVQMRRFHGYTVAQMSRQQIEEICRFRALVEGEVVASAAVRASEETLALARQTCRAFAEERDPVLWGERNREFHAALYADCGLPYHLEAVHAALDKTERYLVDQLVLTSGMRRARAEHKAILAAFEALPDDRWLEITPTAIADGQYSLTVRVLLSDGKAPVNTVVRLRRGSTVLVGGPSHQKGVLIIAISAS